MLISCFRNYTILLLLLLAIITGKKTYAQQKGQLLLHRIDEQNGLSDNNVQCVYKDKNNFVWIGTASGLDLLDGSSITIFRNDPSDTNSITDNNIKAIAEDKLGFIWIGTESGLNQFNFFKRKFRVIPLKKGGSYKKNDIESLAADSNGNIYIGCDHGLYFLNDQTKKITPLIIPGNPEDSIRNNRITHLVVDKSNKLWISTFNGLWSYRENGVSFTHEISEKNDPQFKPIMSNFMIDHSGKIWAGSWNAILKEYDPATGKVSSYQVPGMQPVSSVAEVKQSDGTYLLWLSGKGYRFDPLNKRIVLFQKPIGASAYPGIEYFYVSKDNWLWMGTTSGLYYLNPGKTLFKVKLFPRPITSQSIAIREWKNRLLVSGSGKNFLKAYDTNFVEVDDYGKWVKENDMASLYLQPVSRDIIESATSNGIARINLSNHQLKFDRLGFLEKDYESGNFITCILKDQNETWWVFPWRYGIWKADSSLNDLYQVFNNFIKVNDEPKPLVIADAIQDRHGNLWMADLDEGIIFYDRNNKKFSKPFEKQLGDNYTTSQILFYKNFCYSFSGKNILVWSEDSSRVRQIALPAQIDRLISSIAIDSSGRLWIATGKGLLLYRFSTKTFDRFTAADGLVDNNMEGTLYCMSDGKMIFGSPNYLLSFHPDQLIASLEVSPDLKLEEVVVNGKPVVFDTSTKKNFPYTANNFRFRWSITDYNNPFNNHYYYKLQGIDKDWHDNGTRGEINFANLSPGNYTLLLKGENSNDIVANRTLKLMFEILPPFWRTWWFLVLISAALIAVVYAIYHYRLQQALQLERLRNKISLDLHDDIGSTLSSISILSEMAMRQNKETEKFSMLSEIKENSLSLMEKMDDIVWSINPDNDSMENLFLRIRTFSAKLFEAREIPYRIEIDNDLKNIKLSMQNRQHIYLIMKEAINNMVKYSCCSEAEINVNLNGNKLNILIHDNGKGFNKNEVVSGNGIHSMQKRAEEIRADFAIDSAVSKGTTVTISLKIK